MGRRSLRWACGLWLLAAFGCAARAASHAADAPRDARSAATAERIYRLAEVRYAEGDYPAATELMRRALLQLPETPASDAHRHALVLRLGHTQMRAWSLTGDEAFLYDAQQMLERYAARHVTLFGDTDVAKAERVDVWALLGEVERRIEAPERMAMQDREGERAAAARSSGASGGGAGSAAEPGAAVVDTHAGEPLTEEITREVVVERRRKLATLDDPRVVERLSSDYSLAEAGLVLTRMPGGDDLHGPRGLVRVSRPPVAADDDATAERHRLARRVGYRLVRQARPALRRCYEDAMARVPTIVADSTVEVSVQPDGSLGRARIVDGQLVDTLGDVCLVEQLQRADVGEDPPAEEIRVRVALRFLFQGAEAPDGPRDGLPRTPRRKDTLLDGSRASSPDLGAMPSIDTFAQ